MYRLARDEVDLEASRPDRMASLSPKVHLDAALRFVPDGQVGEILQAEFAAQLTIDTLQDVEIETGGDPVVVVVGIPRGGPSDAPRGDPRRLRSHPGGH